MSKTRRTVTLVMGGSDPRAHVAEFLNSIEEHEERAILAWLRSPEFNAFATCREVAMDAGLGEGEWFPAEPNRNGGAA